MEDSKLAEIEDDLNKVKTSLGPLLTFMHEIKDLRRDLRISSESSATTVDILKLAIKAEVFKDVSSLMIVTDDKIRSAVDTTNEHLHQHLEKIEECKRKDAHLESSIKTAEDIIARFGTSQDIFRKEFEYVKRDLSEKIHYTDFEKLQGSMKNYALTQELKGLQKEVDSLASKSELIKLQRNVQKIVDALPEYFTRAESLDAFEKINLDMMEKFSETYMKKQAFDHEIDELRKRNNKYEDDFKAIHKKVELLQDGIRRKLSELYDTLNSKPWEACLKPIIQQLDEAAKKIDMDKINQETMEKINKLNIAAANFQIKTQMFDGIVERYDEILLEKSSKIDFTFLSQQIEKCASSSSLQDLSKDMVKKIKAISTQLNDLTSLHDSMKSILFSVSQKVEIIRKENFEVSNIASTLTNINEILDRKADKSDIFIIYDNMGSKEEMQKMAEIEEMSRKQILCAVGVLQSFCRTFLLPGENPVAVKKQRLDVFKMLESLQKWIKEGNGEPNTALPAGRSGIMLKSDTYENVQLSRNLTARATKRLRNGSMDTSHRFLKEELPLLNL